MRTLFISLLVGLLLVSCSSKSSDSGGACGGFSNDLRFGTGMGGNGFDLSGESTSFSVASVNAGHDIWFRLESCDDIASRFVRLYIDSGTGTNAAPYGQKDITLPQTYGHITVSSGIRITDVGSYQVRAYYVTSGGQETHLIDANVQMTP
jgi:hypothetical protein